MINTYDAFRQFMQEKRDVKPSLLLHACCAPCSSSVLERLKDVFEITIFFFNPNIDTKEEYQKRLQEFKKMGDYPLIEGSYTPSLFYDKVKGYEDAPEGKDRCYRCYYLRLEETANIASQQRFDFFTTTLSVSPFKNSDYINEIGQQLASKYHISFLYSNYKKDNGYQRSVQLSKELGLYRQDYCGCVFSKKIKNTMIELT